MKKGFIDYWNADRGWGFVVDDRGARFFAHISTLEPPLPVGVRPVQGNFVVFEEGRTAKGPCAIKVRIVKPSASGVEAAFKNAGGKQ